MADNNKNFRMTKSETKHFIEQLKKPQDEQPLKILAVKANKDLKNYIQDVLSDHVLKAKK